MKIYKLVFKIFHTVDPYQNGLPIQSLRLLCSVEKYAQSEESLAAIEEDLRKKDKDLGFIKNSIEVSKTVLEVL